MSSITTYMMTDTQNIEGKERISEQETGERQKKDSIMHIVPFYHWREPSAQPIISPDFGYTPNY